MYTIVAAVLLFTGDFVHMSSRPGTSPKPKIWESTAVRTSRGRVSPWQDRHGVVETMGAAASLRSPARYLSGMVPVSPASTTGSLSRCPRRGPGPMEFAKRSLRSPPFPEGFRSSDWSRHCAKLWSRILQSRPILLRVTTYYRLVPLTRWLQLGFILICSRRRHKRTLCPQPHHAHQCGQQA